MSKFITVKCFHNGLYLPSVEQTFNVDHIVSFHEGTAQTERHGHYVDVPVVYLYTVRHPEVVDCTIEQFKAELGLLADRKIAGRVATSQLELIENAGRLEHAIQNIQIQVDEGFRAREICDRVLAGEFFPR